MLTYRRVLSMLLGILVLSTTTILAQACPTIVQQALETTDSACQDIGRNQACYGNIQLEAYVYPEASDLSFENPGDILEISQIHSLHLTTLDESTGDWGVALLNLQANLPDTVPGQNVKMLLFGDVSLTSAEFLDDQSQPIESPTQAFYFQSGIGAANCHESPSGLILQSPPGAPDTTLNINGAWVTFGSTLFVQASPTQGTMSVSTLAGMAQIQSHGQSTLVIQGAQTNLGLSTDGAVNSTPSHPTPLAENVLMQLVSALNSTQLFVPTYEDAKSNPAVQSLVNANLISQLSAEIPVIATSQSVIDEDMLPMPEVFVPTEDMIPMPPVFEPTEDMIPLPNDTRVTEDMIPLPKKCDNCTSTRKNPRKPTSQSSLQEGIWSKTYDRGTLSGDCSSVGVGDNGGDGGAYNPDDPIYQAQMCVWRSEGIVMLDNNTYRLSQSDSVETYTTEVSISSYDNNSKQYVMTVLDSNHVDVTITTKNGTCTATNVIHYTLHTPGNLFGCGVQNPQIIENETSEDDVEATPVPEETEVIIDPIIAGQYTSVWIPTDNYCNTELAPIFTDAEIIPTNFDELKLIVNGQSYYLSGDGLRGEFSYYGSQLYITLTRRFVDDFNISWQASSEDGMKSCYAQGILKLLTPSDHQPKYQPPNDMDTPLTNLPNVSNPTVPEPTGEPIVPASGEYDVTWTTLPNMDCPTDHQERIPNFDHATISASDKSFLLASGEQIYQIDLVPFSTQWSYMKFEGDNSGTVITISDVQDGILMGTFSYFTPDAKVCLLMLELRQS